MDILKITQSLPGPLALNCSILVGRRLRGTVGGLTAALGFVLPSFLIILLLAAFLLPVVWNNEFVQAIFYGLRPPSLIILLTLGTFLMNTIKDPRLESIIRGLRPAVIVLILSAAVSLGKTGLVDWVTFTIAASLFIISTLFKANPFYLIAAGAVLGLVFYPY